MKKRKNIHHSDEIEKNVHNSNETEKNVHHSDETPYQPEKNVLHSDETPWWRINILYSRAFLAFINRSFSKYL